MACLVIGALLRFTWVGDMEYKNDERIMFHAVQTVGRTEPWPLVGMRSGVGLPNPGLSEWVFIAIGRAASVESPLDLARAVQALNVLALAWLLAIALRKRGDSRAIWLWAFALAAVCPVEVIYERKIWAQSILPIFILAFLEAWDRRIRPSGAFAWGLLSALIGQIHMSGFFLAAGFAGWTLASSRRARWGAWLVGAAVGVIPLEPWLREILAQAGAAQGFAWSEPFKLKFWYYWVTDAFGIGVADRLGIDAFKDFLRFPLVGGLSTWVGGASQLALIALAAVACGLSRKRLLPRSRGAEAAAFWGYGILLTASAVMISRHYLIATFPLQWVWLARALDPDDARGRRLLRAIWALELATTALFLYYVHVKGGAPGGDYGVAYSAQ